MTYAYFGSMTVKTGHRDEVLAILTGVADSLREAGCRLYAVGVPDDDADTILVSELWDSREHHDASLRGPETRAAIGRAMPMLTGDFTRQEMTVIGGLVPGEPRPA